MEHHNSSDDFKSEGYIASTASAEVNVADVSALSIEELQSRIASSVNHRRLNARQIQLTSIAGSIGAALFVAIGSGVLSGPLCLLIGDYLPHIR